MERLAEIGDWMKVNSEAIYGTTASPFKKLAWGRCTQKPGKLYLHVFDWPADGRLAVPLASAVKSAYLLATPSTKLTVDSAADGKIVHVPAASPTPHAGVVVLEIEGAPDVLPTTAAVQPTEGWNDFQTATVGQIAVHQPGTYTASVKAHSKPGLAVANRRSPVLR